MEVVATVKEEVVESQHQDEGIPRAEPSLETVNFPAVQKCVLCCGTLSVTEDSKILECLHAVCNNCVQLWREEAADLECVKVCPVCRLPNRRERLIDNKFLVEISDLESTESAELKCSNGCEFPPTDWCDECMNYICESCTAVHRQLGFTKDHNIRPKDEVVRKDVKAVEKYHCPSHPKELLLLYCNSCNMMTCRDCQLSQTHREHKFRYVYEIADDTKVTMQKLVAELHYKSEVIAAALTQCETRTRALDERKALVQSEIRALVTRLNELVKKTGKELYKTLNEVCTKKKQVNDENTQNLKLLAAQVNHCVEFTRIAIETSSNNCLIYGKKQMLSHLHRVKVQNGKVPNPEYPLNINLMKINPETLEKALSNFAVLRVDNQVVTLAGHQIPQQQHQQQQPVEAQQLGGAQMQQCPPPPPPPYGQATTSRLMPLQQQIQMSPKLQQQQQAAAAAATFTQLQHQQINRQQQQQQISRLQEMNRQYHLQPGGSVIQQQGQPSVPLRHQQVSSSTHPHQYVQSASLGHSRGGGGLLQHGNPLAPPSQQQQQHHHQQQQQAFLRNASPEGQQYQAQATMGGPQQQQVSPNVVMAGAPSGYPGTSKAASHNHPSRSMLQHQYHNVRNPQQQMLLKQQQQQQLQMQQRLNSAASTSVQQNNGLLLRQLVNHGYQQPQPNPSPMWHRPQMPSVVAGASPAAAGGLSAAGGGGGGVAGGGSTVPDDTSFKIHLGKSVSPPRIAASPIAVTSSVPKTPSPLSRPSSASFHQKPDDAEVLDKLCQESLNEMMMSFAVLDKSLDGIGGARVGPGEGIPSGSRQEAADVDSSSGQAQAEATGGGENDDPNDDWCAVCMDGGDLVCCDNCPKVFHTQCHIPSLATVPEESWQCLLCQTVEAVPQVERSHSGLKPNERRAVERLLLELYCQYDTSILFRAPVHPQNFEYLKRIRRPMSFDQIREKLSKGRGPPGGPIGYRNVHQFMRDIRQVFLNAFHYYEIESKEYKDGMTLEEFLETQLSKYLPQFAHSDVEATSDSSEISDEDIAPLKKVRKTILD